MIITWNAAKWIVWFTLASPRRQHEIFEELLRQIMEKHDINRAQAFALVYQAAPTPFERKVISKHRVPLGSREPDDKEAT